MNWTNPDLDEFDTIYEIHECEAGKEYLMLFPEGMLDQGTGEEMSGGFIAVATDTYGKHKGKIMRLFISKEHTFSDGTSNVWVPVKSDTTNAFFASAMVVIAGGGSE